MPVAQSRGHAGKALLIAGVSVVLLLGLAFLVAQAASKGNVEINLGDDRFNAGQVENIANSITKGDGLPFLYQDLVGGDRNLFVQHLGDDPDTGWSAFGAFVPENPECRVDIDRERKLLVNSCDEAQTYPPGGRGLRPYPVTVEDGRLYVDINELSTTTVNRGE
jgi:hypothetical protein